MENMEVNFGCAYRMNCSRYVLRGVRERETLVRLTRLSVMKFSVRAAGADATTSATLEGY